MVSTSLDWSPDGEWLVFMLGENWAAEVFIARPDGSDLTRLFDYYAPAPDIVPAWSPQGQHISYLRELREEPGPDAEEGAPLMELYVVDMEQREETRIAERIYTPVGAWSPDGGAYLYMNPAGDSDEQRPDRLDMYVVDWTGEDRQLVAEGIPTEQWVGMAWRTLDTQ